jgi:hypothetical protein
MSYEPEVSPVTAPRGSIVTPARTVAAVCVIVPCVAMLCVPIYDRDTPELAGFPFFFWWQLLWVVVTAALTALAYAVVRREELARRAAPAAQGLAQNTEIVGGSEGTEAGE